MARKKQSKEPKAAGKSKARPSVLALLSDGEAARLLKTLLERHPELRREVEELAGPAITMPSIEDIAQDVLDRITLLELDDLYECAGPKPGGYLGPEEAAEEMLIDSIQDIVDEMNRLLSLGLGSGAVETCIGLVAGLYRAREMGSEDGGVLGWAPDWPQYQAEEIVRDYIRAHEPDVRISEGDRLLAQLKAYAPEWHPYFDAQKAIVLERS